MARSTWGRSLCLGTAANRRRLLAAPRAPMRGARQRGPSSRLARRRRADRHAPTGPRAMARLTLEVRVVDVARRVLALVATEWRYVDACLVADAARAAMRMDARDGRDRVRLAPLQSPEKMPPSGGSPSRGGRDDRGPCGESGALSGSVTITLGPCGGAGTVAAFRNASASDSCGISTMRRAIGSPHSAAPSRCHRQRPHVMPRSAATPDAISPVCPRRSTLDVCPAGH